MTQPRYAGFWRRLLATIIDSLLLMPVLAVLLQLVYGGAYWRWAASHGGMFEMYGPADLLINYLLPLVLTVFFWVRLRGSPGKLLLGCRVVDARSGGTLGVGQAVLRWFAYIASTLPLCLGFVWIAWDARKQGFHDKIAGSVVVRSPIGVQDNPLPPTLDELRRKL